MYTHDRSVWSCGPVVAPEPRHSKLSRIARGAGVIAIITSEHPEKSTTITNS